MTTVGRFTVLDMLGSTATGDAFVGRDPDLERLVVLKRLSPLVVGDAVAQERFRAHAQLAARVQSAHCVRVFDYVESADGAWIVSEYVEGTTLARLLAHKGRLSAEQSLRVVRGALDGLADIHSAGLVHRDVQAETMVVTRDGSAKLADVGQMTLAGARSEPPSGAAATMSPELARGESGDARSDIYAVGCVLYECFEGRLPFVGDSVDDVLRQHIESPPPTAGHAPPCMREVIAAALEKDPQYRPQTVEEMTARLDACAERSLGPDWWERGALAGLLGTAGVVATGAVVPGIASGQPAPATTTSATVVTPTKRSRLPVVAAAGGIVAVASAAAVTFAATRSGGSSSSVTTSATSSTASTSGVASASPASNGPPAPSLQPVAAIFDQSKFTTTYTVNVQPAEGLTYTWSVQIPADAGCASGFKGNTPAPNQATWFHADSSQGGPCSHGPGALGPRGHNGVVTVVVSNANWSCIARFVGTEGDNGASQASGDPPGACLAK